MSVSCLFGRSRSFYPVLAKLLRPSMAVHAAPSFSLSRRLSTQILALDNTVEENTEEISAADPGLEDKNKEETSLVLPDAETRITCDPLPPDLQRAVEEHVRAAWQPPEKQRHLKNNYLDRRKTVKKSKRRKMRNEFQLTPLVVLGAHRTLVNRFQQMPPAKLDATAQDFLASEIRFDWFNVVAEKLTGVGGASFKVKQCDPVKLLIVQELLAMLITPVLAPFLPPHAYCLQNELDDNQNTERVPPLKAVESIAMDVDYDTGRHFFMTWDLAGPDGIISINKLQSKLIVNLVSPYISTWWYDAFFQLFNMHQVGTKKKGSWTISLNDANTSLPAVLVDMLLMPLDFSDAAKVHPLRTRWQNLIRSDKKKQYIRNLKPRKFPTKLEGCADVEYHRMGPAVLVSFKGPEGLRDLVQHEVAQVLKSSLHFDRKLVANVCSLRLPRRKAKAQDKREMAEFEEGYAEHKRIFDLLQSGTRKRDRRMEGWFEKIKTI